MQIQLKQNEINAALNQYIASQGINLIGKAVDISFTAGRKNTGLTADIKISDQAAAPEAALAQELPSPTVAADTPPTETTAPVASNDPAPETASAPKVSLFG